MLNDNSQKETAKIVLILMIKNESKILERCINNLLKVIDAVCICDTGSTDNTVSLAHEVLQKSNLSYKIFEYPFTDFGESRSKSFTCALSFVKEDLKWDINNTFGFLVDADMVLKLGPDFDKKFITNEYSSYKILQVLGPQEYYNTRLILMSDDWRCKGKTHEFWANYTRTNNANIEGKNFMWFDDVSDGGCKDDKFERDERLLLKGLEEEPELCARYCFYLGQTYHSMKIYEKSIEYYLKRAEIKDEFTEEIWFSLYMTCQGYYNLKLYKMVEKYALEAFEFYPCRSEPLLLLVEIFKNNQDYVKAWKYLNMGMKVKMPEKQLLYFCDKTYLYDFYYHKSHLLFLTNPDNLEDIRDCLCRLLNYKKISNEIETLKALRLTACSIIKFNDYIEMDINPLNDNQMSVFKNNRQYILTSKNKEFILDEKFKVLSSWSKINFFENDYKNIKFISENVFVDIENSKIINASDIKKFCEFKNTTIPVILLDNNLLIINLEKIKLPRFITVYFVPTLTSFFIDNDSIVLPFLNPQTFMYIFLFFSLSKQEFTYFIPPFCIQNPEENEVILSVCPSQNFNEIIIFYKNINDNNKIKINKINKDELLTKRVCIQEFL